MTGPEHYRRGERLLARCTELGESDRRGSVATEAHAHFTAALVAILAEEKFPDSIKWQEATQ
ncbi:hypothetical protein AB0D09_38130 [Streptomyces sp. NPDC049097]|uniref:hypothetical protein n=1 Tax=Streptomyces sp. NPDC049097 TaxID=3155497 RepID=UPI003447DCD8